MRAIWTIHRARGRNCRKNRRYPLHAVRKPHVKVPFIARREGFHSTGHRVVWQRLEFRSPVWVHRPIGFEIPTQPF